MRKVIVTITLLFLLSCSDNKKADTETYFAGFKTIQTKDTTRIYKPNTDTTDYLHFRPLDIDVLYPARVSTNDTSILFRNILGLLEKRANYYTASSAGNGMTQQLAQYFCDGLKCSDSTKVLNFKTQSFINAKPIEDKFPLIIYLSAFNGMSYENFSLFERLAKKGFVVASISSIGRFPGDMTMKNEDLMEQVNDAVATLTNLKGNSNIDFTKIGIIGYSWGGLSGSILASKIPNVACLVSLDGSEFHHYGQAKEENIDFDGIRNSSDFKNMRLSVPYLRLESSLLATTEKEDSVYNFTEKLSSDRQIFKIDSAQHEDFGCLPQLVKESGNCKQSQHFNTVSKLTISFLEDHLKNGKAFTETVGQEISKKTIRKK
ncbi:MAG: dienelactone hydrolase family protein [Haliscomenobacter sp.]|nr:dienelactone hydrolase family protein [Haliscomenobacter sp.]